MNWSTAVSVAVAVVSAVIICRRQAVWTLGAYGGALAAPLLLIVWFVFLSLGQRWGSLVAMAWTATIPIVGIALVSLARFNRRRLKSLRWTALDKFAFVLLIALILSYNGNDNLCHYAIVNTILRGNIPPCSLNDPKSPLVYHHLFDAASAVVSHGFGLLPETALDVVTIACVFACISCLQAVSRMLFSCHWPHQVARLFFIAGFGPSYLTLMSREPGRDLATALNGETARLFVESIFRRPMGLNYLLFLFILAALLPRMPSRHGRAHARRALPLGWLLPIAYLVPQTSEELIAVAAILVVSLWFSGNLTLGWVTGLGSVACASMFTAPVFRAMLFGGRSALVPELVWGWPPTLPSWDAVSLVDGMPVFSRQAAWRMFVEWGPLFFGALVVGARDPRRRLLVMIFLTGLLAACALRVNQWIKADLDRFLFYGTCGGFMLAAVWVDRLEAALERKSIPLWLARAVAVAFIVLPTILGPVGYASIQIVRGLSAGFERPRVPLADDLKTLLSEIGPREVVLTDETYAQSLILSGFVVAAPLASNPTGLVVVEQFPSYLQTQPERDAQWLLLPAGDPRVAGQRKIAEYRGYVLAERGLRP